MPLNTRLKSSPRRLEQAVSANHLMGLNNDTCVLITVPLYKKVQAKRSRQNPFASSTDQIPETCSASPEVIMYTD